MCQQAAGIIISVKRSRAGQPKTQYISPLSVIAGMRGNVDGSITYLVTPPTSLPSPLTKIQVSPKAGNMNAAIFPNSPREEPVIGDSARVVIVNDARHRLKTEFLQRTAPYFFKLNRQTGKNYTWADVGYVQTPQRFEDLGDGGPLGNHAVLT